MKIAIIGAGNVGQALATAAIGAKHSVTISASNPDNAEKIAGSVGASAAQSNIEAVQDADIVVLATPYSATAGIADEIASAASGKTVIDATNPLNAQYTDLETSGTSGAEQLQQQLPNSSVVKALNTVFATKQSNPESDGTQLDGFYASDDSAAKGKVSQLLSSIGFRPIDAGSLRMARSLEEMAFLNISLNASHGWPWQSAWKLVGPTS